VRIPHRVLLTAAAAALTVGLAGQSAGWAAPLGRQSLAAHARSVVRHPAAVKKAGSAKAAPRQVNLRGLTRKLRAGQASPSLRASLPRPDAITPDGADVTSQFDGITQVQSGGGDRPDPSAATNGSQIVEVAGDFLQVYTNAGGTSCGTGPGLTLDQFLGTTDLLAGPQVEFDNFQGHFIIEAPVRGTAAGAAPALWVASSNTSNPCQTWNVYRLTFSGGPYAPGAVLDSVILGQDRRAVLVETNVFASTGGAFSAFSVFAITKSDLYLDDPVSFSAFTVASQAAPVSNAGEPMIDSASSFFLGADPSIGYQLYRMTGSGTPNPSLTLAATIGSPYSAPSEAEVPPASQGPDAGDGRITSSPVFDGSRIWFAHGVSLIFHPTTVRFGYINLVNNTETDSIMTVDPLFSDEFNGSVGVGIIPGSSEAIFLNWAYTDPSKGVQVSPAVDSFVFNGTLPSTVGAQQTLTTGTAISTTLFGRYSSVAVESAIFGNTTCAITTQEYFNGSWDTRLARICSPTTVDVPNVTGDTVAQATSALAAAGLATGAQTGTTSCSPSVSGTVLRTSPAAGQPAQLGSSVALTICTAPTTVAVPNVLNDTVSAAASALQSAGLVVGTISSITSCEVAAGRIIAQRPSAGTVVAIGSAVSLTESAGKPKTLCP